MLTPGSKGEIDVFLEMFSVVVNHCLGVVRSTVCTNDLLWPAVFDGGIAIAAVVQSLNNILC